MNQQDLTRKHRADAGELLQELVALDDEFEQDIHSILGAANTRRDVATKWKEFDTAQK